MTIRTNHPLRAAAWQPAAFLALILALLAALLLTTPAHAQEPGAYDLILYPLPENHGLRYMTSSAGELDAEGTFYSYGLIDATSRQGMFSLKDGLLSNLFLDGDQLTVYTSDTTTITLPIQQAYPAVTDLEGRVYFQNYIPAQQNGGQSTKHLLRIDSDGKIRLIHTQTAPDAVIREDHLYFPNGKWLTGEFHEWDTGEPETYVMHDPASSQAIVTFDPNEETCAWDGANDWWLESVREERVRVNMHGEIARQIEIDENARSEEGCTGGGTFSAWRGSVELPNAGSFVLWNDEVDFNNPNWSLPPIKGFRKEIEIGSSGDVLYAVETTDAQQVTIQLYLNKNVIRTWTFTNGQIDPDERSAIRREAETATLLASGDVLRVRSKVGATVATLYLNDTEILKGNNARFGGESVDFVSAREIGDSGTLLLLYQTGEWVNGGRVAILRPGHSIRGAIAINGFPLDGVTVWATDIQSGVEITTTTNASGTYSFAGLAQGSYRIEPVHDDYDFTPRNAEITIAPSDPNVGFVADFAPDNGFLTGIDDLHFSNYGAGTYPDNTDLSVIDLFTLFGVGVCQSGNTAATCVLSPAAQQWRTASLASMGNGHCSGMSATVQRIWAGMDSVAALQAGAQDTWALAPSAIVRGEIARNHTLQLLKPLLGNHYSVTTNDGTSPKQVLEMIRTNLKQSAQNPYELHIFKSDFSSGHAVTPWKVSYKGKNIFHVYIYDSNWPGLDNRYIEFDVKLDTWRYDLAALNPNLAPNAWFGNAATQSLRLRPTATITKGGWKCPFCPVVIAADGTGNSSEGMLLMSNGLFALAEDGAGKQVGWTGDGYINEVAGAEVVEIAGGLGTPLAAQFNLPQGAYNLVLSNPLTASVTGGFSILGNGSGAGVEDATLAAHAVAAANVGAEADSVRFTVDGGAPPALFVLGDSAGAGYHIQVQPRSLAAGGAITLRFDTQNSTAIFSDSDPTANTYSLLITRITPTGATETFQNQEVVVPGSATLTANIGDWDGSGALQVTIDGQQQQLPNGGGFATWLPTVQR